MKNNNLILIFNKKTGAFFGEASESAIPQLNSNKFIYKKVDYDTDKYRWDGGDFTNGRVIGIDDEIEIRETQLDEMCFSAIESVYKNHNQINIILNSLIDIINNLNISDTDSIIELKNMHDFISKRRLVNERYKNAYVSNDKWKYISKEEEINNSIKKTMNLDL